jgi:tRNA (guanine37-N1)-methyltransferase
LPHAGGSLQATIFNKHQVQGLVRVSCEDGSNFIRSVVRRSYEDPFPPFSRPKISKDLRRWKKLGTQTEATPESALASREPRKRISAFIMNLPDSAIQFLDAFRGILTLDDGQDLRRVYNVLPTIHCYCFAREAEPDKAAADIKKVCIQCYGIDRTLLTAGCREWKGSSELR